MNEYIDVNKELYKPNTRHRTNKVKKHYSVWELEQKELFNAFREGLK